MLLFFKIMFTEFIAEMGDKTQLMLVALTSKYKMRDIILGTAVAILVLNGVAVLAGGLIGNIIPLWLVRFVAAGAFLFFAVTSLKSNDEEEEEVREGKIQFAPLAVFCIFFVAELGDKTQLTAITFGANEVGTTGDLKIGVIVWLACSIGLFAADMLGMLVGYLFQSKMPEKLLNSIAFVIFAIFGIITARQGLLLLLGEGSSFVWGITIAIVVIFAAVCGGIVFQNRKKA
ncbi:MAG: TMEM165/GDT1 family protein [Lachnospiraceae bacterium]